MSNEISAFLKQRIAAGDFPSASYLVAEKGEIVFQDVLGLAAVEPEKIEARTDTIYDLASLTKPLVTGLLSAQSIEKGDVQLESKIGQYFSEFSNSPIADLKVKDLATHTSGMPAWSPLYLFAKSRVSAPSVIANLKRSNNVGEMVEYSDLNFIALGHAIEGLSIDQKFGYEVIDPLGLKRTAFNPLTEPWEGKFDRSEIAASEMGNEYEKQTCIELGYLEKSQPGGSDWSANIPACTDAERSEENPIAIAPGSDPFRNYQIWGEVHDGNAWFMGGVAGHAGLFSTAEEVFKIALQFLPNYTKLLKSETCELFRTNFTKGLNEDRSFAFQLASTADSTAGMKMSPQSFGHLGFTGTSLWIDPLAERVFVLLTNRTHDHKLPFTNINSVRRRFHDIAIDLLDKK